MDDENKRIVFDSTEDQAYHHGARRRFQRWALHADFELEAAARSRGVTLNASAGGLRVAVDCALPEGGMLTIRLENGDRVVRQQARVVWQRELPDGFLAGLAFGAPQASFENEDALWASLPAAA